MNRSHRTRCVPILIILVGLSGISRSLDAQTPFDLSSPDLPTVPGFLNSTDYFLGGIVLGSLAFMESFEPLDMGIRNSLSNPGKDGYAFQGLGDAMGSRRTTLGVSGGMALTGWVIGSDRIKRAGTHTFEALVIGGLTSHFLKIAVGRSRPAPGIDSDDLRPFSDFSARGLAFPSGHATAAFAFATVISSEFGDIAPWLPYVAYPAATWTATTRVLDEKHWVTDVVAGAAVGILTGRLVERFHHGAGDDWSTRGFTVSPVYGGGGVGLSGLVRFR